jgi:hypothetical protein
MNLKIIVMKNLSLLIVGIVFLTITSCRKDDIVTKSTILEPKEIFICGTGWENGRVVPRLWIENNFFYNHVYNYENEGNGGRADDMAFLGNDIYTVGSIYNSDGSSYRHVVWKNSTIITELTNIGFSSPFSIAVNEKTKDIYVVGLEQLPGEWTKVKIWKNGIKSSLSDNDFATPFDIKIKNNDIYVVGWLFQDNIDIAVIWKNGIPTYLTNGKNHAVATSITIIDNDIYVAGTEENSSGNRVAKYWKNGIATSLTDGAFDATATTIAVDKKDVYVGGSEYNLNGKEVAKYWKNGVPNILSNGIEDGGIKSSVIVDNIFYSIGYNNVSANLWYGNNIQFSSNSSSFSSIIVR